MTTATNSPDMNVIVAAGGVLCRRTPSGGDEILVVHRKRYGDWTLPKGKVKPGESFAAAALREVAEETGCRARFEHYLGAIGYAVKGVPKAVLFWRMSLIEQNEIADHEEVAEVLWMPVAAAIQRLTHPDERTLALRASEGAPEPLETLLQGFRRWLWPQNQDYSRLQREFDSFSVELAFLEARSQQSDKSWSAAAHHQLGNVARYLKKRSKDVEGGWVCLHAARRHAIHGLGAEELPMQASMLRAEATKFSSWRAKEMEKLLAVKDELLTACHITNAMALRDEYSSNQYHKIWLLGHQLAILLIITGLGLFLLTPLVVFYSRHPESTLAPWGVQMVAAVLFFGLLGAAFSAAGSLMSVGTETKIPERVANEFVTGSRALFGAGAGLAGYAFYQSKLLNIHVGNETVPGGALAVAFLFGFAGEQLIAHVLGAVGARKS